MSLMQAPLGEVPTYAELDAIINSDLFFSVQWVASDGVTPINVQTVLCQIVENFNLQPPTVLYDISSYCIINGNLITLSVPANVTAVWTPTTGEWQLQAVSTAQQTKVLVRGSAIVKAGLA